MRSLATTHSNNSLTLETYSDQPKLLEKVESKLIFYQCKGVVTWLLYGC